MKTKGLTLLIGFVAMAVLAACSIPLGQTPQSPDQDTTTRQISVTGIGKVTIAPDIAYINIGVNSQSENVSEALDANNSKSNAVADVLEKMGVDPKDIQTTSFNIWPMQQYSPMGEVTGTVYTVDNTVNVTVRDLDKLGQVLEASVQAGANSINNIQFDVADRESALSKARDLAVQNAKAQAAELAGLAGVELDRIINVSVGGSGVPYPTYYGIGGGAGYAMEAAVPVSSGQMVISSEVYLTYTLK
jgi:uncharacterized protein